MKIGSREVYVEDISKVYGCFRCGVILGAVKVNPEEGYHTCVECGENGIVSFIQALDTINDQHLRGALDGFDDDDDLYTMIFEEDDYE